MDKGRNLEEVGNLRRVGDWSYYSLHRRENEGMYTSRYRTYRYITSGRRDPFLEREGMYTASIWYMWYMCICTESLWPRCPAFGMAIPSHPIQTQDITDIINLSLYVQIRIARWKPAAARQPRSTRSSPSSPSFPSNLWSATPHFTLRPFCSFAGQHGTYTPREGGKAKTKTR